MEGADVAYPGLEWLGRVARGEAALGQPVIR